jgi:hypothetical protein
VRQPGRAAHVVAEWGMQRIRSNSREIYTRFCGAESLKRISSIENAVLLKTGKL